MAVLAAFGAVLVVDVPRSVVVMVQDRIEQVLLAPVAEVGMGKHSVPLGGVAPLAAVRSDLQHQTAASVRMLRRLDLDNVLRGGFAACAYR